MASSDSPTLGAAFRHTKVRESLPVFARNGEVVFSRGTRFPPHCVRCGAHAEASLRATLRWHPAWVYGLLLVNPLFYVVVAATLTAGAEVDVPICRRHAAQRRQMLVGGWSGIAVSLALLMGALWSLGPGSVVLPWVLTALGAVTTLASVIALSRSSAPLKAVEINEFSVRAEGAAQAFLDKLPPATG